MSTRSIDSMATSSAAPTSHSSRPRRLWDDLASRLRTDLWERPQGNFDALDGLRGFASLIVLIYHCALFMALFTPDMIAAGRNSVLRLLVGGFWSGIDIFFVLSGFLIGRILLVDLSERGHISYRKFLIRRSFRIFPAYYLILALSLFVISPWDFGVFPFLYGTRDWLRLLETSWANFFYLSNYFLVAQPNILSWGWSLCVEEHFYLILPPLLWLLFRRDRSRILQLTVLSLCVLLPLAGRGLQYALDPDLKVLQGFYYFSHNRFDEIFMGVLVAYFYVKHPVALRAWVARAGATLPTVGILCISAVWIFGGLHKSGYFSVVWQFFVMALGSSLLLLNGLFLDNAVKRFFSLQLWHPLARVSYGTYLLHPFVLFLILSLVERPDATAGIGYWRFGLITFTTVAVSTTLAIGMYCLLERPLLDRGAAFARRYS